MKKLLLIFALISTILSTATNIFSDETAEHEALRFKAQFLSLTQKSGLQSTRKLFQPNFKYLNYPNSGVSRFLEDLRQMKPSIFFGHLLTARFDHLGNIHVLSRANHNVHVSILSPAGNNNYRFASVTKKSSF